MEDKADQTIDDAKLVQLEDALNQMEQIFRTIGTPLQTQERLEALKPRKGCEHFVSLTMNIARENGIRLPSYSANQIEVDQKLRNQLPAIIHRLDSLHQLASDTLLTAGSEYWNGFLSYYRVLNAMAQSDPNLAVRMKPVVDFMAKSSRHSNKDVAEDDKEEA